MPEKTREQGCTCLKLVRSGHTVRYPDVDGRVVGIDGMVEVYTEDPHCPVHGVVAKKLNRLMMMVNLIVVLTAATLGYILSQIWEALL